MKNPCLVRTAALALLGIASLPMLAERRGSSTPPSFVAITPGSIRAAGSPSGPLPPRSAVPHRSHRGHHRGGVVGFGYAVPYGLPYDYYYPQPEPPAQPAQPEAPAEPDKASRTLFEHDGKPLEVHLVLPKETPEVTEQPEPQPVDEKPGPPTILVFRDGRQQEIQNYAILGDKLIVLSEDRAKRIPLEELDVDATTKVNEEQGVDFRLPGKS